MAGVGIIDSGYRRRTMAAIELEFEKPIIELEKRIEELGKPSKKKDLATLKELKRNCEKLKREIFSKLTPWEKVQLARHPNRPQTIDYVRLLFQDFVELHGDRHFSDDKAIITGLGRMDDFRMMVVGHHKGRTTKERLSCYFGSAHPEGYRKALSKMKLAEKFKIPVLTVIDTPGAYPGIGAEERGQFSAIAHNLREMSRLRVPIICIIIGEGGSGGALGIGVGDRLAIMEHAYYSVISPEGCAAILWRDGKHAPDAAKALKLTAQELHRLGLVDDIIREPLGAAHRDHQGAALALKRTVLKYLRQLQKLSVQELLKARYQRHRHVGHFLDGSTELESENSKAKVQAPSQ